MSSSPVSELQPTGRVTIGRAKLECTRLGLGGGPLGGLFTHVGLDQATATVERAWELGLRLYDVAPLYGHGRAERAIGAVLRSVPRESFVLSTKVGRLLRAEAAGGPSDFADTEGLGPVYDYSADGIRRSLEESLERLGLDRIDVLYIHDPEEHLDQALTEAYPALDDLRRAGTVASIGVGTNSVATLVRLVAETDIDCALIANRLTLLDRSAERALPVCVERGVSLVVGGVFNSGLLAAPASGGRYDYAPAAADIARKAVALDTLCRRHGVQLASAALQFPFRHEGVTSVLVGARSPAEITANVAAAAVAVSAELSNELDVEAGGTYGWHTGEEPK